MIRLVLVCDRCEDIRSEKTYPVDSRQVNVGGTVTPFLRAYLAIPRGWTVVETAAGVEVICNAHGPEEQPPRG